MLPGRGTKAVLLGSLAAASAFPTSAPGAQVHGRPLPLSAVTSPPASGLSAAEILLDEATAAEKNGAVRGGVDNAAGWVCIAAKSTAHANLPAKRRLREGPQGSALLDEPGQEDIRAERPDEEDFLMQYWRPRAGTEDCTWSQHVSPAKRARLAQTSALFEELRQTMVARLEVEQRRSRESVDSLCRGLAGLSATFVSPQRSLLTEK